MKSWVVSMMALALAAPAHTFAHTDEMLDAMAAPHGGQLRMAGPYHFELVAKPGEITLYVTDHGGKNIPTAGATGTATVLAGKSKASLKLAPAGANVLKGMGKFVATPDMKVAVSVTLQGQAAQQARFTPLQKTAKGGEKR